MVHRSTLRVPRSGTPASTNIRAFYTPPANHGPMCSKPFLPAQGSVVTSLIPTRPALFRLGSPSHNRNPPSGNPKMSSENFVLSSVNSYFRSGTSFLDQYRSTAKHRNRNVPPNNPKSPWLNFTLPRWNVQPSSRNRKRLSRNRLLSSHNFSPDLRVGTFAFRQPTYKQNQP